MNSAVNYAGCADSSPFGGPQCAGPHPVGQKQASAWGLYDMAGSLTEWCHDWYSSWGTSAVTDPSGPLTGTSRVLRGGSWRFPTDFQRAGFHTWDLPTQTYPVYGFRCARSLP
jgi:formylglycine-generating enzyme required for sulfatase activity